MAGTTIKDAKLVEQLTGEEKLPLSDGTFEPKAATAKQIKEFTNKERKSVIDTAIAEALVDYVKKVQGKGLSENDFTDELKSKLESLNNYDDTMVRESITTLENTLNTLMGGNVTTAIESFNEVVAFLANIEDSKTLEGIIGGIQKTISDFKTETNGKIQAIESSVSSQQKDIEEHKKAVIEEFGKVRSAIEAMESLFYGIEFDTAVSTNAFVRIGNASFHRSLPIHEKMRGCLIDDNGDVVKYLDKSSWTEETRDGSMGQVMVEIPDIYWRFEEEGTKRRVMISTLPLPGFFLVPKYYVSAYEASVQRSTTKLCSVVNSDADYRGGNNTTSYDGTYRSLLGRPATSISRTNFRNYARKRKEGSTEWNCMTYDVHKWIYWLFVIEYATLNSQAAYNAELDANGYRQGGLGDGVTTWDGTSWNNFNGYNPFVPCGHTDSLGNGTGTVAYEVLDAEGAVLKTFYVPRYRGIENPFGHIWQWTDGVNVRISPTVENGGDGLSKVFVCSDPSKFSDTGYEGYEHVGNLARTEGYGKRHIFGERGEMVPDTVGGGSTTYLYDYNYTNIPTSETLRGLLFGGAAYHGATAGFAYANSNNVPSYTHAYFGSRLCFIPAK